MRKTMIIVTYTLLVLTVTIISILLFTPTIKQPRILELPITVTDDFGRNVTITKHPERIVSTAPSNTEILFALGLGSKVVGVTKYCDYPSEVPERVEVGNLTVIGGYADPSIEKIVALNPDLVVAATTVQRKMVEMLEDKDLAVVALDPKNIAQIILDIRWVGKITGRVEEAENLTNDMRRRINDVEDMVKNLAHKPRIYYEVWYDPLMSAGPGTWVNELIETAGGVNIFGEAKERYPQISSEAVIQLNPEVIVIPIGYHGGTSREDFEKRPGWSLIDAVKNDRIYEIDENLILRPGPRIVHGLEELAKIIHPELFK